MPIDRTFLNAWIDDSGSGVDGTVWNKARINEMLNAIDAGIASGIASSITRAPFSPLISNASWQTVTYTSSVCQVFVNGPLVIVSIGCYGLQVNAATTELHIAMPFKPLTSNDATFSLRVQSGISEIVLSSALIGDYLNVTRLNGQTFPTGITHLMGQGFYWTK